MLETNAPETNAPEGREPRASPRWKQHPVLRRLPLLIIVAVGLWLYQSRWLPQERKLVWQPKGGGSIQQLEVQLWAPDGKLLKRDQRAFIRGADPEIVQEVLLDEGVYDLRWVIHRTDGRKESGRRDLEVGEERTYVLPLGRGW